MVQENIYGNSHFMTEEEINCDENFYFGEISDYTGLSVGYLGDKLVKYKRRYGENFNMTVEGSPGTGKSDCFVLPMINYLSASRESMFITDCKGALYRSTIGIFRSRGYTPYVIDLKDFLYGDGIDLFKYLPDDSEFITSLARSIVIASSDSNSRDDFWESQGINLIRALIGYIVWERDKKYTEDPDYTETDPVYGIGKFGRIFYHLAQRDFPEQTEVEHLDKLFSEVDKSHHAYQAWSSVRSDDKTVSNSEKNFMFNAKNALAKFNGIKTLTVLGTDTIDLDSLIDKPIVLFINIDENSITSSTVYDLVSQVIIKRLQNLADKNGGRLDRAFHFILDEFGSIGMVHGLEKSYQTFRSRNIFFHLIYQALSQLGREGSSFVGSGKFNFLLGTSNVESAKWFSDIIGSYSPISLSVSKTGDEVTKSFSEKKASAFPPEAINQMSENEFIVIVEGKFLKLEKIHGHKLEEFKGRSTYQIENYQEDKRTFENYLNQVNRPVAFTRSPKERSFKRLKISFTDLTTGIE